MGDAPEPGNLRVVVSGYGRADVAWWLARAGWDVLALPGGSYLARRGADELVVSTVRRFGGGVEVRGVVRDGASAWAGLCRLLDGVAGHYQAWWATTGGVGRGAVIGETMALGPDPRHVAPPSWAPRPAVGRGSQDAEPGAAPDTGRM
jgi:hypothetical protein